MISGFHKLNKSEKIKTLADLVKLDQKDRELLQLFEVGVKTFQNRIESFSENVIGNFHLPYAVIPNVLVNGKTFFVPAATEESSVIAAASSAAKFWAQRGGFLSKVINTHKVGTIYFNWKAPVSFLQKIWDDLKIHLMRSTDEITSGMRQRGGGILSLDYEMMLPIEDEYKLTVLFDTRDAMGANFINSCLEKMASALSAYLLERFETIQKPDITMAILSNHTPECLVTCKVECDVSALDGVIPDMSGAEFANKFKRAVDIAWHDPSRAVTHNKGIMNGVSAVVIATANDFRAVEAAGHAYALQHGQYRSLSKVTVLNDTFTFQLTLPLALGTTGGLTGLHPMAALSFKILKHPDSLGLMKIIAACGLASNFAAIKSLVSDGIQKGHMRLHLNNLLLNLNANENEVLAVHKYFKGKNISTAAVKSFLEKHRLNH